MHRLPIGRFILLLLLTLGVWWWWSTRAIRYAPGVLVPGAPLQEDLSPWSLGEVNGFRLTGFARYTVRGRVLGRKRYYGGVQAPLVPVDVATGWARMSDQAVLDQLGLTMGNRFFFYEWRGQPPLAPDEIMRSASNNHVIATVPEVIRAIGHLRLGELIEMRGYLVDAEGPEGFHWRSSRRRDDTGNGACELFYVESVQKLDPAAAAAPIVSALPSPAR